VKFVARGLSEDYFPIWLTNNGYNAYYTGKFQNGQDMSNYGKDPAHALMKGWTSADGPLTFAPYFSCSDFSQSSLNHIRITTTNQFVHLCVSSEAR
jgi:hypothetical protein